MRDFKLIFNDYNIYGDFPYIQLQQMSVQLQKNSNLEQYEGVEYISGSSDSSQDKIEFNFANINIRGKYIEKFRKNSRLHMLIQQHNVNILGVQEMQKHFNSKFMKHLK